MRSRTFLTLVVLWPAVLLVLAWVLVSDMDPFADDSHRPAKTLITVLMVGAVPFGFGLRDWWKIVFPEVEPDQPNRFLHRTHIAYSLVLAMVGAAFCFCWLIGFEECRRYLPSFVAVVSFAGVRASLNPERSLSPTAPDVVHSFETRIPDSVKGNPPEEGDKS